MNQAMNHYSMPGMNRVIAAPRIDAKLDNGGRFVSDAGFRADHDFCNRVNVAVDSVKGMPKGQLDVCTWETDPRPLTKSRMQDACFATVATPTQAKDVDNPLACTVLTVSENASEQAIHATTNVGTPVVAGLTMAELEKLAIMQTLERCAGNRTRAARMLGVSVRTLQRKLNTWKRDCP